LRRAAHSNIFADRAAEEDCLLRANRDRIAQGGCVYGADVATVELNTARIDIVEARDQIDQT